MAAKYNAVAKGNPRDPDAPKKYYPSFTSSGRVTVRELAEKVAAVSTVSSIDTMAVLEALLQIIPQEMAEGNIVDLGEFGSFRLRITGQGADTPEALTSRHITGILPQFQAGKIFKQALGKAKFEKA